MALAARYPGLVACAEASTLEAGSVAAASSPVREAAGALGLALVVAFVTLAAAEGLVACVEAVSFSCSADLR